jgi:hypothetical protein
LQIQAFAKKMLLRARAFLRSRLGGNNFQVVESNQKQKEIFVIAGISFAIYQRILLWSKLVINAKIWE